MKKIQISITVASVLAVALFSGCQGVPSEEDSLPNYGSASTVEVSYGMYGENNDLGSPEQIRITWHKNNSVDSALYLTSSVDTGSDGYLASRYGVPHYHYSIDRATEIGVYKITCDPAVSSGSWIEYSCLRDGTFISQQDPTIDNRFVIEQSGSNRLFDSDPTDTGSETVGEISYHN